MLLDGYNASASRDERFAAGTCWRAVEAARAAGVARDDFEQGPETCVNPCPEPMPRVKILLDLLELTNADIEYVGLEGAIAPRKNAALYAAVREHGYPRLGDDSMRRFRFLEAAWLRDQRRRIAALRGK